MGLRRIDMRWEANRLKVGGRLSGYSLVADEKRPTMFRVKHPDGALSDCSIFHAQEKRQR
jgi:hypothetical protein